MKRRDGMLKIIQETLTDNARARLIPVQRLADLKADIDSFRNSEELNGFQTWIASELYRMRTFPLSLSF